MEKSFPHCCNKNMCGEINKTEIALGVLGFLYHLLTFFFFKKNAIAIPKNLLLWQYEEYESHDTSPPIMLVGKK